MADMSKCGYCSYVWDKSLSVDSDGAPAFQDICPNCGMNTLVPPPFMSLREFLLLKDPTDREPRRSVLRGELLVHNVGRMVSSAEDLVERYDIAKASWEEFGAEGPPIGSKVEMLEAGHGGGVGAIRTFDGVYTDDPRFFQVYRMEYQRKQVSLVLRDTWFVSMRLHKE